MVMLYLLCQDLLESSTGAYGIARKNMKQIGIRIKGFWNISRQTGIERVRIYCVFIVKLNLNNTDTYFLTNKKT